MHPATSIIVFSTLNGAGFGLIALICLGIGPYANTAYIWTAPGFGFVMAIAGLLASTFHLGHPERALRALTQWRSSWLSREGCLAILTLLITGLYFLLLLIFGMRVVPIGLVGAILAIVTVYSTSMIYAQLKTVPQWNSKLTPIVFLTSSISTGILALLPFLNFFGGISGIMQSVSLASLSATWLAIILYWRFNQNFKPGSSKSVSTLETATGLGSKGRVRLLEAPHSSPNYLTREMVFKIGRKHANKIRGLAFAIGGGVPLLLLIAADTHIIGVILQFGAFLFHLVGILCTRWLFFAEAEHVVSLYYGHKVSS